MMRPRTKSSLRLARTWGYSSITAVITASRPPNCPGEHQGEAGEWDTANLLPLPPPVRHGGASYRAVQPQRYHHQEEDDGKEGGAHHVGDGFGVGDEKQAGT